MPTHHTKGKLGPDGATRYYVPSQHAWLTHDQIDAQNKAAGQANKIASIMMPIVLGGAFFVMIIVGLSSL